MKNFEREFERGDLVKIAYSDKNIPNLGKIVSYEYRILDLSHGRKIHFNNFTIKLPRYSPQWYYKVHIEGMDGCSKNECTCNSEDIVPQDKLNHTSLNLEDTLNS